MVNIPEPDEPVDVVGSQDRGSHACVQWLTMPVSKCSLYITPYRYTCIEYIPFMYIDSVSFRIPSHNIALGVSHVPWPACCGPRDLHAIFGKEAAKCGKNGFQTW